MNNINKKILIIIPAFNEEGSIAEVINSLKEENTNWDLLVIDDFSKDATLKILKCETRTKFIHLISNLGIGGAVQTGFKYAVYHNYDIAIQFDADGQHLASEVSKLLEPLLNNEANVTIGSRFFSRSKFNSTTLIRRYGIKILSHLIFILIGEKIYDVTSGFRAFDKNAIKFLSEEYPTDYPEPESLFILLKMGFKIKEVPVRMKLRKKGKSSIYGILNILYMIKVILSILMVFLRSKKSYNYES